MKVIKDTCLGVISVISTLIAIVERRSYCRAKWRTATIYTILGNRCGASSFYSQVLRSVLLLVLSMVAMSLMFARLLWLNIGIMPRVDPQHRANIRDMAHHAQHQ